jgi:hypothetical protein
VIIIPENEEVIQKIEIDCAPLMPRPNVYYKQAIEGTGLAEKEPSNMLFGQWTWDYSDVSTEDWLKVNPIIGERLKSYYNLGFIRYASW